MFADRARELDERLQSGAGGPREPRVEPLDGFLLWQPVEVAQLAEQQERAVHRLVGEHDLGELEQLLRGLVGRVLEQAVAGALDPLPLACARAAAPVVLLAADLVGRFAAELDHVERIERDLRVRNCLGDRLLVAGRHVDRYRPDRVLLLVGELIEEALQGLGVATRGGPHDPTADVVGDAGEEAAIGAIADLVHADHHQPIETVAVELVGDHAREDLADRPPPDPQQLGQRRLGHLLGQERDDILEVARVRRAGPGPRHRLVNIAAVRAVQSPQLALDVAATGAEIQMPPALGAVLLDQQAACAAARARRPLPGVQPDRHNHAIGAERHVLDRCSRKAEHPLECGSDPHVVLPRRPLNFRHPAACRRGRRRVAAFCANSEDQLYAHEPVTVQSSGPWAGIPCWCSESCRYGPRGGGGDL